MLRVVAGELLHRRSRTLALLAGILLATAAFTVLTATSRTQRLQVRGTVAKSFRGDYDVLVRPRGSRSAFERATAQVQPNFLSGVFGGISFDDWRRIERLPGVEVAAPIANVGYLLPTAKIRIPIGESVGSRGRALVRARVVWTSDHGLTRIPDAAQYAYVTDNRLRRPPFFDHPDRRTTDANIYRRFALREDVPGRPRPAAVCNDLGPANNAETVLDGPWETIYRSQLGCFSRQGRGFWNQGPLRRTRPFVLVRWAFPVLLTAIDPVAEARLTGLDRAVSAGRYLTRRDRASVEPVKSFGRTHPQRFLPVLAASRTFTDERADVEIERLSDAAAARWTRPFPMHDGDYFQALRFLIRRPHGPVVQRARVSSRAAYRRLLRQLRGSDWEVSDLTTVWRIGPTVRGARGPVSRPVDDFVWQNNAAGPLSWAYAPPAGRDTRFREITRMGAYRDALTKPQDDIPLVRAVGTFEPRALGTNPRAGAAPLATLQPPLLTSRDGGEPLLPNGNVGGYMAQPPALLTTMQALRAFGPPLFEDLDPDTAISAVRVRVAGVTGIDALSRERIRQAAERIAAATGLDVDITAGASGAPQAIDLPAGRYGRPRLALSETWIRKGVAATVLSAVDRKSVVLFVLILVVCALFVANATAAAVRARRTELGVLASLGWPAWRLFAVVLAEVGAVGLAAGMLGAVLAVPLAALAGVDASPARAAVAVPAATALALLAGLWPAARAARAEPAAAVRPPVLEAGRAFRPRTVGTLALVDLLRTPGRTALGALSLGLGVCALTLLLAATVAFHDVLVGTLLGDAVAVRVRGTDYVAVLATVVLGVAAVADVLFLNLRERAAELATLTATGWDDRALGRLVACEGLWIGALGGLAGATAGLAGAALFAGSLPASLLATTAAAAALGTLLAGVAALAPALWLRRFPVVPVLAGE